MESQIARKSALGIVGAGPAGLCMARWASAQGIECEILERSDRLGGIWDIRRSRTPIYESVHLISSVTRSAFAGFPMSDRLPPYPGHREVLAYLNSFADHHGVRERIRFGAHVVHARPEGDVWAVELASGECLRYPALVVANGHNWEPNVPELPGDFAGEIRHSLDYRSADEFRGQRVLVVGGGNSGCDIAVDAAIHAERALLSLRRGYHFVPKFLFGVPTDVFATRGPALPYRFSQPIFERLLRALVGDLGRFGLPRPDHRLFETHPILNDAVVHHFAHGNLEARPDVCELAGRRVRFVDGREEEIDQIVLATGYRHSIPFLDPEVFRTGDRSELFLNVFHDRFENLFVVGLFENDGAAFPLLDLQCEAIARLLRARSLDHRSAAAFERIRRGPKPDVSGGIRHLDTRRMSTYVMTAPYTKNLRRLCRVLGG